MKTMLYGAAIVAAAAIAPLASASSVTTYGDTLGVPMNIGSGISNTNFAITRTATHGTNIELGIKAKQRSIGDVFQSNGVYRVEPGFAPPTASDPSTSRFWWNFDFSADLGNRKLSNTPLRLTIDFVGQDNSTAQRVVNTFSLFGYTFFAGSTYEGTDSLIQGSQNLDFATFGPNFDANALGTYTFTFEALIDGDVVSSVTMQAQNFESVVVIPLPGTAGLAMAGLGLACVRRRR